MNKLSLEWKQAYDYCWLDYLIDGKPLSKVLSIATWRYERKQPRVKNHPSHFPTKTSQLDSFFGFGVLWINAKKVFNSFITDHTDTDYINHLEQLLAIRPAEEYKSGRVPLYTDINENEYCRDAVCAYITRCGDRIEWKEFRHEENRDWMKEPRYWVPGISDMAEIWANVGPFSCSVTEYEHCLRNPPVVPEEILRMLRT